MAMNCRGLSGYTSPAVADLLSMMAFFYRSKPRARLSFEARKPYEQVVVGLLISSLMSSLSELIIVLVLPFLFYLVREHTIRGFWAAVGLRRPRAIAVYWALGAVVASFMVLYGLTLLFGGQGVFSMPGTVTGQLKGSGMGVESILTILLLAFVQTALAEEIFFRGFLYKQLAVHWGFVKANVVQAATFGLLHGVMLLIQQGGGAAAGSASTGLTAVGLAAGLTFGAGAIGYLVGFINEQIGDGSIVPGWIGHGVTNTVTFFLAAFTHWI